MTDVDDPRQAEPAEEYIVVRPEAGPFRKVLVALVVLAIILGVAVGGGYWWYQRQVNPPGPPGAAVTVDIKPGSSTSTIASELSNAGVVANSTVFSFYVRRKHAGPFEAGVYRLRKNSDFDSAIKALRGGPSSSPVAPATKVRVPEGLTVTEIATRIQRQVPRFTTADFSATLNSGKVRSGVRPPGQPSWEGVLYPATYDTDSRTDFATLLNDMAAKMDTVATDAGLVPNTATVAQKYGITLTPYQTLIVASLIQQEAGSAAEAPSIATVIYNRLRRKMPLGIDATSRYEAAAAGKKVDFESASPYNTRRKAGLPPTPISSPGEPAIRAALQPADGPWIYYVLTEPGKHTFVTTNNEFLRAKQQCIAKKLGCG